MKSRVVFSHKSDEWETPQNLFDSLNEEFNFQLDCAANAANRKVENYRGPDHPLPECRNGLVFEWSNMNWLNPPYSMCRAFVHKAQEEKTLGHTTVLLLPSRTDTKWWHESVWDRRINAPYYNNEVRFIKGRLKFGGASNGAPFPSVVVVMRGY